MSNGGKLCPSKFLQKAHSVEEKLKGSPLQPQTIRIDDFNGDGTHDLIIFCHDRLILYPVIVNKRSLSETGYLAFFCIFFFY